MKVELRSGELRETIECEKDVFFIGCRVTDPSGHFTIAENLEAYKSIFDTAVCRTKEICLANGMRLEMCMFATDDPSILAMMKPYAGMKLEEVVYGDTELIITV
ncbi:MAG: hypothetical protein J1E00_01110 [Oscillospiraceae bacterium]|nr:hypothetical protein [Oscillospiraceae bacterium]